MITMENVIKELKSDARHLDDLISRKREVLRQRPDTDEGIGPTQAEWEDIVFEPFSKIGKAADDTNLAWEAMHTRTLLRKQRQKELLANQLKKERSDLSKIIRTNQDLDPEEWDEKVFQPSQTSKKGKSMDDLGHKWEGGIVDQRNDDDLTVWSLLIEEEKESEGRDDTEQMEETIKTLLEDHDRISAKMNERKVKISNEANVQHIVSCLKENSEIKQRKKKSLSEFADEVLHDLQNASEDQDDSLQKEKEKQKDTSPLSTPLSTVAKDVLRDVQQDTPAAKENDADKMMKNDELLEDMVPSASSSDDGDSGIVLGEKKSSPSTVDGDALDVLNDLQKPLDANTCKMETNKSNQNKTNTSSKGSDQNQDQKNDTKSIKSTKELDNALVVVEEKGNDKSKDDDDEQRNQIKSSDESEKTEEKKKTGEENLFGDLVEGALSFADTIEETITSVFSKDNDEEKENVAKKLDIEHREEVELVHSEGDSQAQVLVLISEQDGNEDKEGIPTSATAKEDEAHDSTKMSDENSQRLDTIEPLKNPETGSFKGVETSLPIKKNVKKHNTAQRGINNVNTFEDADDTAWDECKSSKEFVGPLLEVSTFEKEKTEEILHELEAIECPLEFSDNGSIKISGIELSMVAPTTPPATKTALDTTTPPTTKTVSTLDTITPPTTKTMYTLDTSYGRPPPLHFEEQKTSDESPEHRQQDEIDCPIENGSKSSSKLGSIELDKALATTTAKKESKADNKKQKSGKKVMSSFRKSLSMRPSTKKSNKKKGLLKKFGSMSVRRSKATAEC